MRPSGWNRDTVLVRLVEKSGDEILLVATQSAVTQFASMEKWHIYDIDLKGSCVKTSQLSSRYNIRSTLEIRISEPCKFNLSSETWVFKFPYTFRNWETFNQLNNDAFVDVIGRVLEVPQIDPGCLSLKKAIVTLGFANYVQPIELLGEHANLRTSTGDIVAFGGLKVREYRKERSFETTLLTIAEVNPGSSPLIPTVPRCTEGEPTRKAMRMTEGEILQILQVKLLMREMEEDAQRQIITPTKEFFVQGTFKEFDDLLFEKDPPIVGEGLQAKLCWPTVLTDATGDLHVKVWEKPCLTLLKMNASKFREVWERGVDHSEHRENILAQLNEGLDTTYRAYCSMKVWSLGGKSAKHEVHLNVNAVQIV